MVQNNFETVMGALNVAPILLSGQYKIVVKMVSSPNHAPVLWLDDYNGRRTQIDLNTPFLQQVANFLQIKTEIIDKNSIRYGAHHNGKINSWHIPLYLGNFKCKYPDSFNLYWLQSNPKLDKLNLNESKLLYTVDLKYVGLHNIFEQIWNESDLNYPVYFNWEDSNIELYGFGITEGYIKRVKFDTTDSQANQSYLDVFNNRILRAFDTNKMFYPKFLNLEFEFDLPETNETNSMFFKNFHGHLAYDLFENVDTEKTCKLYKYVHKDIPNEYTQTKPKRIEYFDLYKTVCITNIQAKSSKLTFITDRIQVGDNFIFGNELNYFVSLYDIDEYKYPTLIDKYTVLCRKLSRLTNHILEFKCMPYDFLHVKIVVTDNSNEQNYVTLPSHVKLLDFIGKQGEFEHKFHGIGMNQSTTEYLIKTKLIENLIGKYIKIGNEIYQIVDNWIDYGYQIISVFDKKQSYISDKNKDVYVDIFEEQSVIEINSTPINYYNFVPRIKNMKLFDTDVFESKIPKHLKSQYISKIKSNNWLLGVDGDLVREQELNSFDVKDMMFNSVGFNCYMQPNYLNIDNHFNHKNGCIDYNGIERFGWFLIKSKSIYEQDNELSNRYWESDDYQDIKLTSRVIETNKNVCETVFLGVKYLLPIEYKNYRFCVVLDVDTPNNIDYKVVIENNLIILYISKFISFCDLIRNGSDDNKAIVDISMFLNLSESYNTKSEKLDYYQLIKFDSIPKLSESNSNYFHIEINNATDYFDLETNQITIFSTEKITFKGKQYQYKSVKFVFTDIRNLTSTGFDFKDLQLVFYDNSKQQIVARIKQNLGKFGINDIETNENELLDVIEKQKSSNKYLTKLITSDSRTFECLTEDVTISLREDWFQIDKDKNEYLSFSVSEKDLKSKYMLDLENSTYIDLFTSNQLWWVAVNLLINGDCKLQSQNNKIIRSQLESLNIQSISRYLNSNSIRIENQPNAYINIRVLENDYNVVIWSSGSDKNISKIERIKTAYYPYFEICDDAIEFQNNDTLKTFNNRFKQIFDANFNGNNITATALYNEVTGNIVSSLYCKSSDIELKHILSESTLTPNVFEFNVFELLSNHHILDNLIITNDNSEYIESLNKNKIKYIREQYTQFILDRFYYLDNVKTENGTRLNFEIDGQILRLPTLSKLHENVNQILITFKRK